MIWCLAILIMNSSDVLMIVWPIAADGWLALDTWFSGTEELERFHAHALWHEHDSASDGIFSAENVIINNLMSTIMLWVLFGS